jgi:hypothetical protein
LSHAYSPFFCCGYFGDGASSTICLGWPLTRILLISASQVARIIGVSHQHSARKKLWEEGQEGDRHLLPALQQRARRWEKLKYDPESRHIEGEILIAVEGAQGSGASWAG